MKILFLLTFVYCLAKINCQNSNEEHPDDPEIEGETNILKTFIKEVQKRKGSGFQPMAHDECSTNCLQKTEDKTVGKHFFKQLHSKRLRLNEFFNKTALHRACVVLNETVDCIRLCSESQAKAFLSQVLDPFKYMCLESDFIRYASCYREVFDETWTRCNGPEFCQNLKKQVNTILREDAYFTDEKLNSLISLLCQYLTCYQDCQHDKMLDKCGESQIQVLNKFIRSVLKTVKENLYPEDSANNGQSFPFQCNRVGLN